jgi:hypothetical protein
MLARTLLILGLFATTAAGQDDEHTHPTGEPPLGVERKMGLDGKPCWYWQHSGFLSRIEMTYCGVIALTPDQREVAEIGPGGYLRIEETTRLLDVGQSGAHRELVAVPGPDRAPVVTYLEDGETALLVGEAADWVAEVLSLASREVLLGLPTHLGGMLDQHGVTVATDVVEALGTAAAWAVMVEVMAAREQTSSQDWRTLAARALDDKEGVWIVADVVVALAPSADGNPALVAELIELGREAGDEHDVHRAMLAIVDHADPTREQLRRILDLARRELKSEYLLTELLTRSMPNPLYDDEVGRAWLRAVGTLRSGFAASSHLRAAAEALADEDLVRAWLAEVEDVPSPTRRYELLRDAPHQAFAGRNLKRWVSSVGKLEDGKDQGRLLTFALHQVSDEPEPEPDQVEVLLSGAGRHLGAELLLELLSAVPDESLGARGVVKAFREAASDLPDGETRAAVLERVE